MQAADVTLQKSMPHSVDAEKAVLGAILIDNSTFDQAAETLSPEDFYFEAHRKIFISMLQLSRAFKPIDTLTVAHELQNSNDLEALGGVPYIAGLMDGVPRVSNIEHYVRIIREKSTLRKLIHSANEILERGFSNQEDVDELLNRAERSIFEISQANIRTGFRKLQDLIPEVYQGIEMLSKQRDLVTGISTGYYELDAMTSGLQPSDLIIIAARPGLGKTSFALNIGQHAAMMNKVVGIFSLEMAAQQLVNRLICAEARVDSHRVRTGKLHKEDWQQLGKAITRLDKAQIFIDDTPGISVTEMRSKARRLKSEYGLDLLIVDYLQLMSPGPLGRSRYENRQQEISAISRSLKGLAKELNVPLIAISQLSRAPEQRRGDHKPQLSDLRESGSIEQDADVVLFIYREDLYSREENPEEKGIAQIIIGKQRNGPVGIVRLAFIEQWTKFENLAPDRPM
ncbi:MAG TPA: replicative DNA helicase [Acidobacteriota bacterium]|nr:replicative DNA helicase [Acidobacteriota bacterium]